MQSVTGTWHNQHGSILHLVEDGAKLSGRFRPGVGIAAGRDFPVVGAVSGDGISFTVPFEKEGAITSWVGHVRRDIETTVRRASRAAQRRSRSPSSRSPMSRDERRSPCE